MLVGLSYPRDMETLGERIRYAREAKRKTQAQIAAHFRIKRPSVSGWESGDSKPEGNRLYELANYLGVSFHWLLTGEGDPPPREPGEATRPISRMPPRSLGEDLFGQAPTRGRTLPVYAAAMGGEGHVIVTFDAVDYVQRPPMLENVRDAYGVLIVAESMKPAYRPGDTALVHPHLPPQRDTDVVLFHTPPTRDAEAIIKHLDSFNDLEWVLEQYNPAKTYKELRADWPICHRVVGRYNAR